jgi:hypothetical protein
MREPIGEASNSVAKIRAPSLKNDRNAVVISSSSILRRALVAEAFKGAKIFALDWKGRQFSREETDTSVLAPLKAEASALPTVCIFDPELMDRRQKQCITYCLDNSAITANFLLLTAAPTEVSHLIERTAVVFDATQTNGDDVDYRTASIEFFNCVFKRETGLELDKQDLQWLAEEVAKQSPDMVAHFAVGVAYAYVEIVVDNQFNAVENWLRPVVQTVLDRMRKGDSMWL